MDLRPIPNPPTDDERSAIDAVLGPQPAFEPPFSYARARAERPKLLRCLHAAQLRAGWISPGALGYIASRLHIPPAEAYGVATFYAMFSLSPRAPRVVHVCDDIACRAAGAEDLCAALTRNLGPAGDDAAGKTWVRSPCLGLCEQAPAALLQVAGPAPFEHAFGRADEPAVLSALTSAHVADPPRTVLPPSTGPTRLLARAGKIDPQSLDEYRAHGGYEALRLALAMGPQQVIREVTDAKLVGRGGAAFPTGRKWDAVSRAPVRPHYLVCNADESEPGTFKDRVLMEDDPFALIEAMTIAGFATGSERGLLYIRGEYPLATRRLAHAISVATSRGLLGDDILGKGVRFEIEIVRGAGAYICGEETALFNSIEGLRGEPRNKPPFPVEQGVFGKPTCINNVETLLNVLPILTLGAAEYRAAGTEGSPGTRLFCLSGHIERPGLYEKPFGVRLDALIAEAGGVRKGRKVQAVLLGGAAGTFVLGDELSVPLTFEDTRKIGATLGSGVIMVFDDTEPMIPILRRIAQFFRDESCGQCVPCRVGTVRQEELLSRISAGRPLGSLESEAHLLKELGQVMRDASICGLGQTASSAVESAARKLPLFRDSEVSR
ncbi:MAG: NAD(P)H-dependent oxidoreductase subunit E [Polyangiaceae bacterium]